MRKLDIFCPSQASTAICLTMEPNSKSKSISEMAGSSSPAIDRYNPIIRDSRRCGNPLPSPPVTTTITSRRHKKKNPKEKNVGINIDREMKNNNVISSRKSNSWSCTNPGDFISPPGSTRHLLSGKELLNTFPDLDQSPPSHTHTRTQTQTQAQTHDINKILCDEKPVTSCISPSHEQVVVLRVSLHCRGCVKKMRKHISRMEGVRSFNIDFAAKKVTVSGKVTALEVLSSISKVKNAQLWAPTISSEFKSTAASAAVTDKSAAGSFVGVVAS